MAMLSDPAYYVTPFSGVNEIRVTYFTHSLMPWGEQVSVGFSETLL
jgi:hypothetical protein